MEQGLSGLLESLTSCLPGSLAPYTLWAAHRLGVIEEVQLEGRRFSVTKLVRLHACLHECVACMAQAEHT